MPKRISTREAIAHVVLEREKQKGDWAYLDEGRSFIDWGRKIETYVEKARLETDPKQFRQRMIELSAFSLAAVEFVGDGEEEERDEGREKVPA